MANTLRELGSANGFDPIGTTPLLFIGGFAHGRTGPVPNGKQEMDLPIPTGMNRIESGPLAGGVLLQTLATYQRRTIEINLEGRKAKRDLMVLNGVSPQAAESLLSQLLILEWVMESPAQALGWPTT